MKRTVLAMTRLLPREMDLLEQEFEVIHLYREADPEATLQHRKNDVQAIVSSPGNPIRRNLIEALPALEIIAQYAVGYDNVDLGAARDRQIKLTNTPDVLTADTADTALALTLAIMRRVVEGDVYIRVGKWLNGPMPLGVSLAGKTAGIVGLGRIGQAIAKRLAAFEMQILYTGRTQKPDMPYQYYDDLATMAAMCDVLVLSCTGGEGTHHLVNAEILDALGPDGFLINISRGSVIDEAALVNALKNRTIRGAGLDVFQNEPFVPEALQSLDNVVLLPHIGSATHETRTVMGKIVVGNLLAHFSGKPLLTEVL